MALKGYLISTILDSLGLQGFNLGFWVAGFIKNPRPLNPKQT